MGKHFPDGPVLFTLIAILTVAGLVSLAFDRGGDNQERERQGQTTQIVV
jgi:hypothetical protein